MQVKLMRTKEQLSTLYQFRHKIYVDELQWLAPQPDKELTDHFDTISYNYAAFDSDGAIVGSIRVTPDSPMGLPLERCYPLDDYRNNKKIVEISRFVVDKTYRSRRLGTLLIKTGWQRALILGATHLMLDTYVAHGSTYDLYWKLGCDAISDQYYDPSYKNDQPVVTMSLCITNPPKRLTVEEATIYKYVHTFDPNIEHGFIDLDEMRDKEEPLRNALNIDTLAVE